MSRLSVVEELAARISALPLPARIDVDGVDAAGKTTLADELAGRLPEAAAVRPAELADVILDNSDPDEPRLSPGGADRRS